MNSYTKDLIAKIKKIEPNYEPPEIDLDYYAVIQDGECIWGVGATEEEAIDMAIECIADPEFTNDNDFYERKSNGIYVVPCSKKLYDVFKNRGSVTYANYNDGICYPSELDELETQIEDKLESM